MGQHVSPRVVSCREQRFASLESSVRHPRLLHLENRRHRPEITRCLLRKCWRHYLAKKGEVFLSVISVIVIALNVLFQIQIPESDLDLTWMRESVEALFCSEFTACNQNTRTRGACHEYVSKWSHLGPPHRGRKLSFHGDILILYKTFKI